MSRPALRQKPPPPFRRPDHSEVHVAAKILAAFGCVYRPRIDQKTMGKRTTTYYYEDGKAAFSGSCLTTTLFVVYPSSHIERCADCGMFFSTKKMRNAIFKTEIPPSYMMPGAVDKAARYTTGRKLCRSCWMRDLNTELRTRKVWDNLKLIRKIKDELASHKNRNSRTASQVPC